MSISPTNINVENVTGWLATRPTSTRLNSLALHASLQDWLED